MLRKFRLISSIAILITFVVCSSCTSTKVKKNIITPNNTNDIFSYYECDDYEYADVSNIIQWSLFNDGSFIYEGYFGGSWLTSSPISIKGYDINLKNCNQIFKSNRHVIISVIDTYIDISHYAFTNIWMNHNEIPDNMIDDDKNGYIDDIYGWNFCNSSPKFKNDDNSYHGTFIVGEMCGFDPNINFTSPLIGSDYEIMCIQAISGKSINDVEHIIKAIKYAENNGSSICCLSFSMTQYNKELYNTIKESSMLFVVAAGNETLDLDENDAINLYPAKFNLDNIIVVADMRSDGKLSEVSNWGNISVDVAAPGTDIISTAPDNQFIYSSGTSFAVPYVACEAALIFQQTSNCFTATQIKEKIINNVSFNASFRNKIESEGYINIFSALESCE